MFINTKQMVISIEELSDILEEIIKLSTIALDNIKKFEESQLPYKDLGY